MEESHTFLYILHIYLKLLRYFLSLRLYITYLKRIFVIESFYYLDIIEEKVRICQIEYHLLHSVCHLGQKSRILTVLRSELPGQQRVKHNYGFIQVPNEYTLGAGFRRVRGTDTVPTSALSPSAPTRLRCRY